MLKSQAGWKPMDRRIAAAVTAGLALVALAGPLHAQAEPLRGTRFLEVMQNNTLSGTTEGGAAFNLYFLPGGVVTYDDSSGARDRGRWSMDPQGDVCVRFDQADVGREHCYQVEIDGRSVTWRGKSGDGGATLRGGVVESFLKPQ
jgi:phosphate-selective porin